MRRYSIFLLLAIALVFAMGTAGCGCGDDSVSRLSPLGETSGGQSEPSSDSKAPAPSEILAMMVANTEPVASETATFDLAIDLDVDASAMPEEEAVMFEDPWKLSGSVAFETATQSADVALELTLMDETMDIGLKALDQQIWLSLGENWYEMPGDMLEEMGGISVETGGEDLEATLAQLQGLMTDVSLDPIAWFKDQDPVKVETIDGAAVYHMSGSNPDWDKVLADLVELSQNPTVLSLMGEVPDLGETVDTEMPTAEEMEQVRSMLEAMIEELQIDLWVQQDNSRLRKATITLRLTAPTADELAEFDTGDLGDMDLEGFKALALSATINLNPNQKVNVKAPDSPRSMEDLQMDIMQDPSMLGPFGTMLMGMSGGF